ncbi:MAG: DUF2807 domain-containing protein [Bacteroidetes bacterium]|nr:DUF2807 domain-containing protein [Bacteroidota bacterium]
MKTFLVALVCSSVLLFSCNKTKIEGSGSVITEQRNVANFYSIKVNGSSKVYVTQGLRYSVSAKAYENLLPIIETRVENGILIIGYKNNANVSNDNSEINITMPSLSSLELNGDGIISTIGSFNNINNFSVSLSGSGIINVNSATPTNYILNISGSGNINSFGVTSQNAVVNISGSGNASLSLTGSLKATISGSGNIYYKGDNINVTSNITGSGKVIKQ